MLPVGKLNSQVIIRRFLINQVLLIWSGLLPSMVTTSYNFWKPLQSFVLNMAEHQNIKTVTVVGGGNECNSSEDIQGLVRKLSSKLPTRRVHGNALTKRQRYSMLTEVRMNKAWLESQVKGHFHIRFCIRFSVRCACKSDAYPILYPIYRPTPIAAYPLQT
jgi:hypothetical protein